MSGSGEDDGTGGTDRATPKPITAKPVRLLDSDPFVLHFLPSISDEGT